VRIVAAPDFPAVRERLAREVSAIRARDVLASIVVIVPSELARAETRRDLARRLDGTLGVDVVSLERWVDAAAREDVARAGGRRLSEAGFERLAARVLEDRARARRGGPLLAAADSPGTARLLASTLADLYEGGFDPGGDELASALGGDPLRRELPGLFRELDEALRREGLFDRHRLEGAAAASAGGPSAANGAAPALLAFGFHDLTPLQRRLFASARGRDVAFFVPGTSAAQGRAGEAALEPLLSWARERGAPVELASGEREPLVTLEQGLFHGPALRDPGPDALELAVYPTESAEIRGIAGRILEEVREHGRSFDDFLVTLPGRDAASSRLVRRVFAKAEVPLTDGIGLPASRTDGGRRALSLARVSGAPPDAPEVDALEFLAPLARAAPDVPAAAEAFLRARDAEEATERFRELHVARLGAPAPVEVDEALATIALVLGRRPLRPRDFAAVLASTLDATRVRDPVDAGGVLLLSMDAARGVSRPVAFHAGLVRGAVRRPPGEDPLLPDGVRARLVELHAHRGLHLALAEERAQERLLLARFAFESGSERVILSCAERERVGGEPRNPSGLFLDVAAARAGRSLDPFGADLRRLAAPRAAERGRRRPVDATDLDLAILGGPSPPSSDDLVRLLREPRARHLPRVLRAAQARWGETALTPWDGALSDPRAVERVAALMRAGPWSASSLEALVNCPFAFLLRRLGLGRPSGDEDDYAPVDVGELFHTLAERLYRTLGEGGRLPLRPTGLPEALALLDESVRWIQADLGAEPARRRLRRRATLAALRDDLALVLAREAHRSEDERTLPLRFELAFGERPDAPAPALPLPDGSALALRGKVDRVDRRLDGALEIVDFKTGRVRAKSGALRHDVDGKTEMHLQLPVYLQAVPQALGQPVARALYYHATSDKSFREVVYTAADLDRDRREIADVLSRVVARARRGWFPCVPTGERCCRGGNAAACGPSVAERFRRKLAGAELAEHVALVQGRTPADEGERP
jgi:RecB family exonuclease